MNSTTESRSAYRCIIPVENSAAVLEINRRKVKCSVLNTSRDGFSIQIDQRYEDAVRKAKRLVLRFSDESWTVSIVSQFSEGSGYLVFGLQRLSELTDLRRTSGRNSSLAPKFSPQTDPSFLLTLMIAFIVVSLCTPGVGDSLGTSEIFRNGISGVMNFFTQMGQ